MNNSDIKKKMKDSIGYVPPGVMVAQQLGEDFQDIIGMYNDHIWSEGVMPLKYRYLIALATAIFDNNEARAKLEMNKAIKYGANREEIIEVIKQQVWMKGAPTLVQVAPLIQFMNHKFNESNI
ncbi:4-carboxymuconolactone decarboxylase [Peptoclostridium litorale DSM 5388]|uniref:Carboxymuconolactone decarboxylase-like domain-containing protein n=1 Tax=Peptoclostridium litorale DSM 5388 TaxID=1121324 RepID=A0A069RD66_PEPLI|nr:carboxymuconolactone decarboxylase family protein [Peptoclostridium litorale]KDR94981.1 hypothetical protein CLIT_11c00080 [Peptoclostridium litorale DSM 5388]SIN77114.1 4-carboxymuconolactone decarboxylase [Peptoclostridium litorale DSM 5388]